MPVPMWRRYARFLGVDLKADVDDELAFHLEQKIDDLVAQRGCSRKEARREALRQFGDLRSIRQTGHRHARRKERQMRLRDHLGLFARDLQFALRTLIRKERGFAAISVLTLALGIAANTAVFSVVNTIVLRPLPFPDSDRLVWFSGGRDTIENRPKTSGLSAVTYQVAAFRAIQETNRSFAQLASYNPYFGSGDYTVSGLSGEAQSVSGVMIDSDFLPALGVHPLLGRNITAAECRAGGARSVLLSHAMWQRQFGGDPRILGRGLTLNKQAYTIAGVLPASFDFGAVFSPGLSFDIFVPGDLDEMSRWGNTLAIVGRLKPGVTIEQAQREADTLIPQLQRDGRWKWGDYTSSLTGLKEHVTGKTRRSLTVLWGAVGLILLLVCVNLSNLMLARAAARRAEFALRSALGAGLGSLFRQLLAESATLATAGSLLGAAVAWAFTTYLAQQGSFALPLLHHIRIDVDTLLWTLVLGVTAAVLLSLAPIHGIASHDLQSTLREGSQSTSAGPASERLRGLFVISEVALACVLLFGAGLLLRSFLNVLDVDLGFRPAQAAVMRIDFDDQGKAELRGPIFERILSRVTALPGIEAAGVADMLPLGRNRSWGLEAKGRTYSPGHRGDAIIRVVTPGYFAAMGIRLQNGRDFTWADSSTSERVIVINQAAARANWPGEDPVGRIAMVGGREVRVIASLADVRDLSLETHPGPEMYVPITQAGPAGAEMVIRTRLDPGTLAPTLLRTLRELNPAQPAATLRTLQNIVDRAVSPRRFFVLLVSAFAALGLVLAALGIFGVISYSVSRRTQEIGIRMALGASASGVQFSVLASALRLVAAGVVAGGLASYFSGRFLESLLFGTRPTDPVTFIAIALILAAIAVLAGYLPARRASRIDPILALRR
ncbi:MAG: ABC transporter permease [Acidobacteria bacterium]|nr:ABC transporter permease [Acidobacteriota bacterium]